MRLRVPRCRRSRSRPSVSPAPDSSSDTCAAVAVAGPYTCSITISDNEFGLFTANASVSFTFSDGTFSDTVVRSTAAGANNGPGGSGPAVKQYVDANVSITPQEKTNEVGDDHVFTITTNAFPAGTTATFVSITPALSPAHATTSTCDTPTYAGG